MCYIYTIEYYIAIRISKLTTTRNNMDEPLKLTVELEPICMIPFTYKVQKLAKLIYSVRYQVKVYA